MEEKDVTEEQAAEGDDAAEEEVTREKVRRLLPTETSKCINLMILNKYQSIFPTSLRFFLTDSPEFLSLPRLFSSTLAPLFSFSVWLRDKTMEGDTLSWLIVAPYCDESGSCSACESFFGDAWDVLLGGLRGNKPKIDNTTF